MDEILKELDAQQMGQFGVTEIAQVMKILMKRILNQAG